MDRPSLPALHPGWLPPGTVVGPWRVEGWAGRGVYGAVYRAVPVGAESAVPVALKVAVNPEDPRFAREVELLSRMSHPHVPHLVGHGEWLAPDGRRYAFLAMQWVDGVPLYDWARQHPVSCHEVRGWLAQLARALEALHAQGGVHRDVKGANVLVRRADGGAVLTDFGAGTYPGAATLTPPGFYPGTPAYQSPESLLFERQCSPEDTARYEAGPADDLYSLGVTACKLLTGEYPELTEPAQDEHGTWRQKPVLSPVLWNDSRVDPGLRAVVLRMLSVHPEQRGTAKELAEELEQPAPLESRSKQQPRDERNRAPVWRFLPAAAAGLMLAVWAQWFAPDGHVEEPAVVQAEITEEDAPDAGTAGLGEAAASCSLESASVDFTPGGMTEEALPEPLPGQTRPDAKGRCPLKGQVVLNKGCWLEASREECAELDGQMFKGTCYVPFIPRGRRPNSSPMDLRMKRGD